MALAACGREDKKDAEPMVGMANPMVEITDDAEFEKQLGIAIDTSQIMGEISNMFVISKSIADIRFIVNDLEDNDIECCLRATKDDSVKANPATDLAGYYYEFEPPVELEYDNFTVSVYSGEDAEGARNIYSWNYDGTYCTLAFDGQLSQMRIATVLDGCMAALNMSPFA